MYVCIVSISGHEVESELSISTCGIEVHEMLLVLATYVCLVLQYFILLLALKAERETTLMDFSDWSLCFLSALDVYHLCNALLWLTCIQKNLIVPAKMSSCLD